MKTSMHVMVYEDILNKIKEHIYGEGEKIPSESELETFYNVSKAPVRQALSKLQLEGYIERLPGKGTYVSGRKEWPYLELNGLRQELIAKGKYTHCQTHVVRELYPEEVPLLQENRIEPNSVLSVCERIRYLEGHPIQYMCHYVTRLNVQKISSYGNFSSLLAIYGENGIAVTETDDVLEAVGATEYIASLLQLTVQDPLLLIRRSTFSKDGLVEFLLFYIKTDMWKYRVNYHITDKQ